MNQDYIVPNNWSIIEEGFNPESVKSSESLFSIGNGAMGQRANFEEFYSGPTFQGSYIAGVYGISRKNEQLGKATAMVEDFFKKLMSSSFTTSR